MYNTKFIFITLFHLYFFLTTLSVFAQDSLLSHKSARFEIGPGFGVAGEGGGFSGRLAFSYLQLNWGGLIRWSGHDGGKGNIGGWFGPPREKFYDYGILLSYVPIQGVDYQIIASAGLGSLYGEQLTDMKYDLEEFGIIGFVYELGIASAGSTLGWSLNIMGNVNSVSILVAFILSLTLGYQK